jgi:hypothetical protein
LKPKNNTPGIQPISAGCLAFDYQVLRDIANHPGHIGRTVDEVIVIDPGPAGGGRQEGGQHFQRQISLLKFPCLFPPI